MHLDIGLPLLSELEQLRRAFWQNHNCQNHFHNQDKTLDSHEQTQCSQPYRQSPDPRRRSDNANNHIEPNHLTQIQDQNSTPESHSEGQQLTHDTHDTRTEYDHLSKECNDHSPDKCQTCCRSASTDLGKNRSETYEHNNPSGQPKTQQETSQRSNRPRRTCRVLWDRTTEDSSFL